jgi:predicted alpha/beta hydrolase family esterase
LACGRQRLADAIAGDARAASPAPVTAGVPYFVFNRQLRSLSGAQDPATCSLRCARPCTRRPHSLRRTGNPMTGNATVLIVPGLREHVPEHWQTLLAARCHGCRPCRRWSRTSSVAPRASQALDDALRAIDGPVILVAHSAGVMMVAHWASVVSRPNPVRIPGRAAGHAGGRGEPVPGRLSDHGHAARHGWLPIPRRPLPFPSLLAASRNDPLCAFARAQALAQDWGSKSSTRAKSAPQSPRDLARAEALELIARPRSIGGARRETVRVRHCLGGHAVSEAVGNQAVREA